ncbi:MAG: hypothetical protein ACERKZ_20780 [Lachnotalea sp.]
MDIIKLLDEKKKEILLGMDTTDPVTSAYKLGAYNLCDELLSSINPKENKTELLKEINGKKARWAIREFDSSGYNIISGDEKIISKCIKFIDDCFQDDHYMAAIHSAQELFPELKWEYALDCESYKELKIEYVYVRDTGCFPIDKDDL